MADESLSEVDRKWREFIAWQKEQGMYSPLESHVVMHRMYRVYNQLFPALDMLDKVLGMFESLSDKLQPEDFQEYCQVVTDAKELRANVGSDTGN